MKTEYLIHYYGNLLSAMIVYQYTSVWFSVAFMILAGLSLYKYLKAD